MAKKEKEIKSGLVENTKEEVKVPVQKEEPKEEPKVEEVNPTQIGHNTRAFRQ
jgi:hypothetical protein